MRIGIDFDNTIAGYDHLFLTIARERGWVPAAFQGAKKLVRDTIRRLPDGELRWMELQAVVYGARMAEARPIAGVEHFLLACRQRAIPVHIVSHKTRFAARDPLQVDLHQAASAWLTMQGFFSRLGVGEQAVFFEPTRADKCRRIAALGCTHFIDDLEEVFRDPSFPASVTPYLLGDDGHEGGPQPFMAFKSWRDIQHRLFPDTAPDGR